MILGSQPAVGLDVGSSVVKAVQLRRSGSTIELEKLGTAEVGFTRGTGDRAAARIDAIRRAMADGHITAKQVVTSVSGESVIVRYIQLPDMPESELRSALRFEAEEYIPYNLDEVYLDSDVLGRNVDEAGAKVDVLLVSAKKDTIHAHADLIRAAGLTPAIVDLDSFAFFNCFEVNYQPKREEAVALINIGSGVTNINIYHSGTSRFSRDITIAGASITDAIQSKLGISASEAERLKISEGLPEPPEPGQAPAPEGKSEVGSLLDTIRGTVERITGEDLADDSHEGVAARLTRNTMNNLAAEVRRSIQFYESQPNAGSVERAIIGGGTAKMKNIEAFFRNELNVPVETIDPLRRVSPGGRQIDARELAENKTALGVSIGLALRKVVD